MKRFLLFAVFMATFIFCAAPLAAQDLPQLKVSPDGHHLQTADGKPFFYLADTAWELIHRLDREEADTYLKLRQAQGFNVIQTVVLSEFDGLNTPNAYGDRPFKENNPTLLATEEGENNDYWNHVEYIIKQANKRGLYVALLPTWGHYWNDENSFFDKQSAAAYGSYVAKRYGKYNIIWILGGDRNPKDYSKQAIIRSMAEAIRKIDSSNLITYHPAGWQSSATWFHKDNWLDFNSRQSGHQKEYNSHIKTYENYLLSPAKPVADIEPLYEVTLKEYDAEAGGYSTADNARRSIYWAAFYGACGVAYGHNHIWQMYDPKNGFAPKYSPNATWRQTVEAGAGTDIPLLKNLLYSRPFFSRRPAPELLVEEDTLVPGKGIRHIAALMDDEGSYAMVYNPGGRSFSIKGSLLKAQKLKAWWLDPKTGKVQKIGKIKNSKESLRFTPPTPNIVKDWVLIVDDATKKYPAPNKKTRNLK